jgi:4-hydroxy-3-methylbut-2-enyl diphosphate reductase
MSVTCYIVPRVGFCSGVSRAVDMANQVLRLYKEFYIVEDIIHNKIFMADIISRGAKKVHSVDEIPDGGVVMFSTHGVSPNVVAKCEKKGLTIVDATCPIVNAIQKNIIQRAQRGETIIVIGDKSHIETIGMVGCASDTEAFVVSNEADVEMLPSTQNKQVVFFIQTTFCKEKVEKIIRALKKKIPHIVADDESNICPVIQERQNAVKKILAIVDLVFIVGSKNSSNTMRLVELAQNSGKETIRIDSENDINIDVLDNIQNIAIASGTSTSEHTVRKVIEYFIEKLDDVVVESVET